LQTRRFNLLYIMYTINQNIFKFQDWVCRLVTALHMLYNNVLKKPITEIEDIERFATTERKVPMLRTWAPLKSWLNIVIPYAEKYHNKKVISAKCKLFWKIFESHLNKWRCIWVNINSSKEFQTMRQTKNKIEWDFSLSKPAGHWLCIFKKDWKYFLLNSWFWDSRDIKELDINTKWLFKSTEATVLY